jgi:hypothetical protein
VLPERRKLRGGYCGSRKRKCWQLTERDFPEKFIRRAKGKKCIIIL